MITLEYGEDGVNMIDEVEGVDSVPNTTFVVKYVYIKKEEKDVNNVVVVKFVNILNEGICVQNVL
jgi:hypothetical protein